MTKEMPLHNGESLVTVNLPRKRSWTVRPSEHVGHEMTILGRVERDGMVSGMMVVECSCGERYRMANVTVDKALGRGD